MFDIDIEGTSILDLDIVQQGGGVASKAIRREVAVPVSDGFMTVRFSENFPMKSDPMISGIEVKLLGPHFAHAVAGGPYFAVDSDNSNNEVVQVNAEESHAHGGTTLEQFVWREGGNILGTGEITSLTLPVGEHVVSLTVFDSSGDTNTEMTTITVFSSDHPAATSLSPVTGNIAGGTQVTITGSAFGSATGVRFGLTLITGPEITVVNNSTIRVTSPATGVGVPVSVSVITPIGESNQLTFSYVGTAPIDFMITKLTDFVSPTSVAFGPDGKLYVGNTKGQLGKFTLNDSFDTVVNSVITTIVSSARGIHGIAFNPMESADVINPTVYISTSDIFHGESRSSFGNAINGKIQAVQGANLDSVTDLVTGLPVSELDHAVSWFCLMNSDSDVRVVSPMLMAVFLFQ